MEDGVGQADALGFRSRSETLVQVLRDRVLDGDYAPGEALNEVHLAKEFGISRGPVREAVQKLVHEGILVASPYQRTRVVKLSDADVDDIYTARHAIEREAAERLVHRHEPDRFAPVREALERLGEAIDAGATWSVIARRDLELHRSIVSASGSARLEHMFASLAAETLLCSRDFREVERSGAELREQHRTLVAKLEAGDLEAYGSELRWHLENSAEAIRAQRHDTAAPVDTAASADAAAQTGV